ncbi:MAG: FmdB family zinc ribbon protein [Bryobacteraceae bacterium]
MPLYEYRCLNCSATFEVRQKFSDEPVATHADCGGQGLRLLSAPQLHFKGTGFYITDYGKGGKDAIKPGGDKSNSNSETKAETKSDSKSDTKSEGKTGTKAESKPAPAPASTKSE